MRLSEDPVRLGLTPRHTSELPRLTRSYTGVRSEYHALIPEFLMLKPFLAVVAALWPLPAQPMHPHRPPHPFPNHPALFRMRASQNNRIMTNGRLLLILIVAAASGCAGAEYAIAPTPPVLTPSGPPAGPAETDGGKPVLVVVQIVHDGVRPITGWEE